MVIKKDNKTLEEKHWEGIKETTGVTKEEFQKVVTAEEEIKEFLDELQGYMNISRHVASNLNFDPALFMLWKINKEVKS